MDKAGISFNIFKQYSYKLGYVTVNVIANLVSRYVKQLLRVTSMDCLFTTIIIIILLEINPPNAVLCYNLVYEFSRIIKQPRAFPHRRDLLCKCDTISILLKLSISIDKPFLGNDANRCTLIVISA